MAITRSLPIAAILVSVPLAGCGSSGKGTSTSATSHPASAPAQSSYAPVTSTSAPSTGAAAVITAKSSKLGMILAAGPKRLTVYMFEADRGASSSCSGECAAVWPPVVTTGKPQATGGALTSKLGTITRSDGKSQVTYNGHPLYYFAKDGDAGDTYGQGIKAFGAGWYVLAPAGSKIDTS